MRDWHQTDDTPEVVREREGKGKEKRVRWVTTKRKGEVSERKGKEKRWLNEDD